MGLFGNAINSIGSQIVMMRLQLIELRGRVGGKMIGKKTPNNIRKQRENDLALLLARLEQELPMLEGKFAGMRFRFRELDVERRV